MVGFVDAVKMFFRRYTDFQGRSSRSEYWWAQLGLFIIGFIVGFGAGLLGGLMGSESVAMAILIVFYLAIIIPSLAIGVRRLHDLDKSGWFYLLALIPLVSLILLVWFCMKGTDGPNRFGDDPLDSMHNVFD